MSITVYGHVFYQNKVVSDLLSINIERLTDFVYTHTLGVWRVCEDEIAYIDTKANDILTAKDIALSLINLVNHLREKCVFCDGNVAIVAGDDVVYIKIQKDQVEARYGDLEEFPTSI